MKATSTDVLIVGAGPTGLALGCDLARRGIAFRIVDKAAEYFIGSKGKGLQPRSLEVMDDLGIVDQVVRNGKFHIPFRAYDGAKVLGEMDMHAGRYPTPSTPYASSLITPQWRVEEALRGLMERGAGRVEPGMELVSLTQDEDGVTATMKTADGDVAVRAKYLVACDGGKSFVRKFLAVPFEGETHEDERMYVGDVRVRGLDREAWHSWRDHPDGWLALCPLPSTDQYQFQAQIPKNEEREPSFELFREIVATRTKGSDGSAGLDIELLDASWISLYRVNVRMVSKYRVGRVFLAGDAAHVHPPAGGQGMNTGIQDAYNLGWKLGAVLHGAPESLLDTYEEERFPVAAAVLGLTSSLYRTIVHDAENEKVLRNGVTLQLGITYSSMSLSRNAGDVKLKIAAGDRAPDAPGRSAGNEPLRLFDVLRGPQFTLLRLFGEGPMSFAAPSVKSVDVSRAARDGAGFVDSEGHVAEAYGGGMGEYVLVRPDGYVGWMGMEKDLPNLKTYLSEVTV